MNNLKKLVGIEAAKFVKDGMVVGLGTGSTAAFLWRNWGAELQKKILKLSV